jgi:hypothetical protein
MAMLASAVWLAAPSPTAEGALIGIDGRNGFDSNTQLATELFAKAVDGRDNSSGFSFSVDEHDAVDQVL